MGWTGSNLQLTRRIVCEGLYSRNGNANTTWIGVWRPSTRDGAISPLAPSMLIPSLPTLPKIITPSGRKPPKKKVEEDELGCKIKLPLYHQCMTSAALPLAVDHTFTGSYAKTFCPSDPHETLLCTCESVLQSPTHIITSCPLHYHHRVNTGIHSINSTLSLWVLFSTCNGTPKLLSFLQANCTAFHPLDPSANTLASEGTSEGVGWCVPGMFSLF